MSGRFHGWKRRPSTRWPGGVITLVALIALMAFDPSESQAREGLYLGFGLAQQDLGGDLTGNSTLQNADGSHEARLGAPDAGQGVSMAGGYGLTEIIAVEFHLSITQHDAVFGPATQQEAELTSAFFGVRLNLPVGDQLELFGKVGFGGYELVFEQANFLTGGNSPQDKVRLSGSGFGAGIGVAVRLGGFGVELGAVRQTVEFDTIESLNFPAEFSPALSVDVTTISLLLTFHFQ